MTAVLSDTEDQTSVVDSTEKQAVHHRLNAPDACKGMARHFPAQPTPSQDKQVVVEADEIVFRAGEATLTLKRDGGVIEIRAPEIRLVGKQITSEAEENHTTKGNMVVSEAGKFSDLLGKLIRINGQCVKINC